MNADVYTTYIRATAARLRLFTLLVDVDDALYLGVTVTAGINDTFRGAQQSRSFFIFLLFTWVLTFMPLLMWALAFILLLAWALPLYRF